MRLLFANPDGSFTVEASAGPERVENGDGTWSTIDTNLVAAPGGGIAPRVAATDIVLSGGATAGAASPVVASVAIPADAASTEAAAASVGSAADAASAPVTDDVAGASASVAVGWDGKVPVPSVSGPVATYADIEPGVDLRVRALPRGVETYIDLKERPAVVPDTGFVLDMPLSVKGLTVAEDPATGGLVLRDLAGRAVARTPAAVVWGAQTDPRSLEPTKRIEVDTELVTTSSGSRIRVVVPADFLNDPAVTYPVTIDPTSTLGASADVFVQKNYTTAQGSATELKAGTSDGGATYVARSYLSFNVAGLSGFVNADTVVDSAAFKVWEHWAYSCTARSLSVSRVTSSWSETGTTWTNKPTTAASSASVSDARRDDQASSSSCYQGWAGGSAGINVKTIAQEWASGQTNYGLALTASETDSYGWKRFWSSEAPTSSQRPSLSVTFHHKPATAGTPTVSPAKNAAGLITTLTPTLSAKVTDLDGGSVRGRFRIYSGSTLVWEGLSAYVTSGSNATVAVPAGKLSDGILYTVRVYGNDGTTDSATWSTYLQITVDSVAPSSLVTSTAYPNDGVSHGEPGTAGQFVFSPPSGVTDIVSYKYWTDEKTTPVTVAATGTPASATVSITPATAGVRSVSVQAIDRAGNLQRSPTVYSYVVGAAVLLEPKAGAQLAKRVRVRPQVVVPSLTKIAKVEYRRGSTATAVVIAPAYLHSSTGAQVNPGTDISALGPTGDQYLTWDAIDDLGVDGGSVEISMTLTTADGTGPVTTPWVPVVVSTDADGAESTDIGPGGLNLLTGDFTVSSTDASEFGMTATRVSSSRTPDLGYTPQRQALTDAAASVAATTGFTGAAGVTLGRDATTGHDASHDSLTLTTVAGAAPAATYATVNASGFYADTSVTPALSYAPAAGNRYRFAGWFNVPAAAGLTTTDPNGLTLALVADGTVVARSRKVPVVDAWAQVSVDATIPAGATTIEARVYGGYDTASARTIRVDELSLRRLWAPYGPQWATGIDSDTTADFVSAKVLPGGHVNLLAADGTPLRFNKLATSGTPTVTTTFVPEPGSEDLVLTGTGPATGPTSYTLTDADGAVTLFTAATNDPTSFPVAQYTPGDSPDTSRYQWVRDSTGPTAGLSRLWRIVNPAPAGVTGCVAASPATALPRGCEVLEFVYATSTTATTSVPGDVTGQVKTVKVWSWDGAAVTAVDAARYEYDSLGRLVAVWDPRVATALKTQYTYDSGDPFARVATATSPGELPWRFTYATLGATDPNPGRLKAVTRASLVPGSTNQTGPDIATTIVYGVPLTRTSGGPYDLAPADTATWGQSDNPTDATAVFPPQQPATVLAATSTAPGSTGYRQALVYYLNGNGTSVNTATPTPAADAATGYIDTEEHDWRGNTIRTLDASARRLALASTTPSAQDATWLNELGLTGAPSADIAEVLDTETVYTPDGIDVTQTRGPLTAADLTAPVADPDGAGPLPALPAGTTVTTRPRTSTTYDQGKPDAAVYHLPTTETSDAVLYQGATEAGYPGIEAATLTYGYDPVITGSASGWTWRTATKIVGDAGAGGTNLTATTKLDTEGRPVESRKVDSAGSDARTTLATFYTAGPHPTDTACGNRPEWAGQPCKTWAANTIPAVGAPTTPLPTQLPTRWVKSYTRTGDVAVVEDTANGVTRTSTSSYDGADRLTGTTITATSGSSPVDTVHTGYDPATGDLTDTYTTNTAGTETGRIHRVYDALGRMVDYTDASGSTTHTTFDTYGRVQTVTDTTLGTSTSYTYDATAEPRGYLTGLTDSVAGTMAATYGPDGQILTETLPGAVTRNLTYNAAGAVTTQTYEHPSAPDGILYQDTVTLTVQGQWASHATSTVQRDYTYDRLGRLTTVDAAVDGDCTRHTYGYDNRANRTTASTAAGTVDPGTNACTLATPTGTTQTFDTADRLVAAGYSYDALGRTTTLPGGITNTFYANDLIAGQATDSSRMSWTLDPGMRRKTFTSETLTAGSWGNAVTKTNHYDGDDDNPSWIAEDATNTNDITRNITGPAGSLAATSGKTGPVTTVITDLHGDVVLDMVADPTALTEHRFDEFGQPEPVNGLAPTPGRYGWLGGKQRSAETLGGLILMGVRLYSPATGRFLSPDPVDGGSASAYDYCNADPVNCADLDGTWSWKKIFSTVARVAEVASWIPGPIGTAAAAVSAGAYLATGNRRKAAEMALTAAANLVGAGAAVRVGMKAAKVGFKAGRRVASIGRRLGRSCNSFDPDTPVTLADGTQTPISALAPGDLVQSPDPLTGRVSIQPILDVIVGQGDKHIVDLDIDGHQTLTATANHPIWVDGRGWTDAIDIHAGDHLRAATGGLALVRAMHDHGWLSGHTVYNLNIANTHTYTAAGVAVHNASCMLATARLPKRTTGVYVVHFKDGSKYVGRAKNIRSRTQRHFQRGGKFHHLRDDVVHISHTPARRGNPWALRRLEQEHISHYVRSGYQMGRGGYRGLRNLRNELRDF